MAWIGAGQYATSRAAKNRKIIGYMWWYDVWCDPVFSQSNESNPGALSFWLANTSELLHFVKQDRDIGSSSIAAQNHLADVIHLAFSLLTTCLQSELAHTMPAFLSIDSGQCCVLSLFSLSVCPLQPGIKTSLGEIETLGLLYTVS